MRAVKDIIADASNHPVNEVCVLLSSDYSAAFDSISRSHSYSTLLMMGFPENIISMIKNLYEDAKCKILMNNIDIKCFEITSGCPQGCSLSGTLFNISILPLLVKLNLLPKHTDTMPYITYAQKQLGKIGCIEINPNTFGYADDLISIIRVNLSKDNPINQISNILKVYEDFSKISGLKNN